VPRNYRFLGGDVMSENLRIWDALGKTDPAHTKQFQRSGGFKGTAIKPMWCNLRMTEMFGPCGIGWGMEKPTFETHQADKEMLVFCTVGVWYLEKPDSASRGLVYGVGGDKYLISQSSGLRASDEAFKAAYTDAIGNAMKFIGVAADVHMGLFDDNKYVQQMKEEFKDDSISAGPSLPPTPLPNPPSPRPAPQNNGARITEPQSKRFFALAKSGNKSNDEIRRYLLNVCHCERSLEMPRSQYEAACKWAESIPSPTAPDPLEITDDDIPF
jgi:hypothetical protein